MSEHAGRRLLLLKYLADNGRPMKFSALCEYARSQNGSLLDVLLLGQAQYIETNGPQICSVTPPDAEVHITELGYKALSKS